MKNKKIMKRLHLQKSNINPFQGKVYFRNLLKTSENHRFFDVFMGCIKRTLTWNELIPKLENKLETFP